MITPTRAAATLPLHDPYCPICPLPVAPSPKKNWTCLIPKCWSSSSFRWRLFGAKVTTHRVLSLQPGWWGKVWRPGCKIWISNERCKRLWGIRKSRPTGLRKAMHLGGSVKGRRSIQKLCWQFWANNSLVLWGEDALGLRSGPVWSKLRLLWTFSSVVLIVVSWFDILKNLHVWSSI